MALLRLGLDITRRYDAAKRRRGALDYDDLIVATRRLLESAESAAWVLYKLDGGIDHVLVDEAQDTNPDQWEVIRRLTEEFFVGARRRSIAIARSSPSATPSSRSSASSAPIRASSPRCASWFEEQSQRRQQSFEPVELTVSFRSTPAVLDAVDWVFGDQDSRARRRRGGRRQRTTHSRTRGRRAGSSSGRWSPPRRSRPTTTDIEAPGGALTPPHERLARLIAVHAKSLIGRERRARKGELLHAGHFMVLVRRRNAFVNALVRELKREQIEVAGVDRLNLGEELAIQDLLAMARFVLLPQDDLNLACLLKSPLIGLDEDKLFTLAWKRTGHLWRALRESAREPDFAAAHRAAVALARRAPTSRTPFDFFAQALGPEGGRRAAARAAGARGVRPDRRAAGARAAVPARRRPPRCRASCAGSRRAAARSSATSTPTAGTRCAS